jgi:apolipoprotein N-acyltransferase
VPFGEYLPFDGVLSWLGLSHLTGGSAFASGDGPQTIRLPGVPAFSPLICYEVIFPGQVTDPSDRPDWLLNITNDGWFGLTNGPYQHLALARMRSIEEGLPLVRSASTGVSAVIDAYGRTVSQLPLDRTGILESPLPKPIAAPVYSTGLKVQAVFLLAMLVVAGFVFRSLKLRGNKPDSD